MRFDCRFRHADTQLGGLGWINKAAIGGNNTVPASGRGQLDTLLPRRGNWLRGSLSEPVGVT